MIKTYKGLQYIVYYFKEMEHFMEHFNGYVKLPEFHPYQKYINKKTKILGRTFHTGYDKMNIDCHGGLTFSRKIIKKNQKEFPQGFSLGSWIGWDYAHSGDFVSLPFGLGLEGKKWTEKEVEKECKSVIRQLLKIKK